MWGEHRNENFIHSFQMKLRNGMTSPVFGRQNEEFKPNREYEVPKNIHITKVRFFADGDGQENYIGGFGLFDQHGELFAKFGADTNHEVYRDLALKKGQYWVGMRADTDAFFDY